MRPRRLPVGSSWAVAGFAAAAVVLVVVAGFFLQSTQARQRQDLRDRYADRTVVTAALLDSLFQVAFTGQGDELSERLRAARIPAAHLNTLASTGGAAWAAVLDSSGRVIGASSAAPPDVLQRVGGQPFVRSALRPGGYGLGDIEGNVVPTAIGFPTPSGWRAYVSASPRRFLGSFLQGALEPLPGVQRARAYLLDGNGHRLAVTAQGIAVPARTPVLVGALRRADSGTYRVDGDERFYASHAIRSSRWRVVVTVTTARLYESASGVLPWVILALSALALIGVVLLLRRLLHTAGHLREANASLAESNAELARSNADLEQFAYVASHDLSEPLRTVAGFSQLISKRYRGRLDADADLFIDHMGAGVDRMQELIDDLLLYSRVGRAPIGTGPVDLDEVLGEVLHGLEPAMRERGAQVTSDDLPTVRGEHAQLRQVLQNLVANAVKFTAPDVTPRVHVGCARVAGGWQITVTDNGIGVAAEQRDTVFKMFGRLHPADAYPGTGIGLAIAKRVVERHGGRIRVEPGPGGGSVFAFTLPDRAPVAEAAPRAGVPA